MGRVEGITLVLNRDGDIRTVESVAAEAGRGLEGDYHSNLTLIAAEALEGLREDTGIELSGRDTRRNVLTSGIDLNALVGERFKVGDVECVGVELCEPCTTLEGATRPGVIKAYVHRAGLNADILTDGEIAVGDAVERM